MDWTNDILPKITISVKKKPVNDGTVQFIGFRGGGKKAINNLYKPIKNPYLLPIKGSCQNKTYFLPLG